MRYPFGFNTQPPEGGWLREFVFIPRYSVVSTHSRLKAAGNERYPEDRLEIVSTHSRLKAAGIDVFVGVFPESVSTHSRLKAAGYP